MAVSHGSCCLLITMGAPHHLFLASTCTQFKALLNRPNLQIVRSPSERSRFGRILGHAGWRKPQANPIRRSAESALGFGCCYRGIPSVPSHGIYTDGGYRSNRSRDIPGPRRQPSAAGRLAGSRGSESPTDSWYDLGVQPSTAEVDTSPSVHPKKSGAPLRQRVTASLISCPSYQGASRPRIGRGLAPRRRNRPFRRPETHPPPSNSRIRTSTRALDPNPEVQDVAL